MDDKKTILVVDDEADIVKVLKFRFEKMGFKVLVAGSNSAILFLKLNCSAK